MSKKKKNKNQIRIPNMEIPLDFDAMQNVCLAPFESFEELGEAWTLERRKENNRLIFIDRGADILAVAHLDVVAEGTHFHHVDMSGQDTVFCTNLDDRLGAYLILDLLPKMGVKCDVLLTEGEEQHQSTAEFFDDRTTGTCVCTA